ncbi:MAG: prepilin-type N-terminal cleavage/methylation domain-containing protein [Planctomycetes bacterium]|jgi:prepilin-type N-terminal cleavage/methylation domain-containing protein|nr:prepilin-type N-terminal cleavage/methylation domain-containing protein [Planctomycetota bacterium]
MKAWKKLPKASRAFTLVEVVIAMMILGMCIVAAMGSIRASIMSTAAGTDMTQAVILAQGLREWTMNLPWNDPDDEDAGEDESAPGTNGNSSEVWVDDLNDLLDEGGTGTTYTPPVAPNGAGTDTRLDALGMWTEHVDLTWRDATDIDTIVADGASDVVYVQVTISKGDQTVLTTGWIITRRD